MSENKFETVSSIADNYQVTDEMFDEIIKDSQLSDTWDNYALIGDVMRDDVLDTIQLDLSASIAQAIEQEPTVLAPVQNEAVKSNNVITLFKTKVTELAKPFGQLAIAASAAGLMVLGVQQSAVENEAAVPSQVIQTTPFAGIADPVSLNFQSQNNKTSQKQAYIEQKRRFQALLSDHQQQVKLAQSIEVSKTEETKKVEDPIQ